MKILFVLGSMLFLCWLYGKIIAILVSREAQPLAIAPQIGYAYLLVSFYGFYMGTHSAILATYAAFLVPLAVLAVAQIWRRAQRMSGSALASPQVRAGIKGDMRYVLVCGALVTGFAIWPYMLSGWGNYWQSGNRDMEDGLYGRDAYLSELIFDNHFDESRVTGDRSWHDFAKVTGTVSKYSHSAETYREWYAGDGFRFQYSSLALWSVVFREPHGMDILLEQELADLLMMFSGIYFLCRRAFLMSERASATAAAASVLSAFYLGTYFAGHEGSMMYGALSPALLFLFLDKCEDEFTLRSIIAYSALILCAVCYSYPHPLAMLLPPVALYRLAGSDWFRKWRERLRPFFHGRAARHVLVGVLVAAILTVALIGLWHVTAAYRIRQEGQYRAWGFTHDWVIVPLFLGLIPSPVEGMTFLGVTLSPVKYWLLIAFSGLLAVVLAVCYTHYRPVANRKFFLYFGACWVPFYFIFRYFIVDSYYLFKFLYTHQYVLIAGLTGYFATARHRIARFAAVSLFAANLASDSLIARAMFQRPYNHNSADMARLLHVDPGILGRSFIDVPGGEGVAVRQVFRAHGIETSLEPRDADYFIVPSDPQSDITGTQFSEVVAQTGSRLSVKRAPAHNYLMVRTWNEPEWSDSDPALGHTGFRWISSGKNDNLGVYLIRPADTGDPSARFLRICMQPGPSATGTVPISVTGAERVEIARVPLDGIRCVWIPGATARSAPQPLVIHSGVRGKSLLPHDDRILLYRVFGIGWTDKMYDDWAMRLFNLDRDVTTPTDHIAGKPGPVRLGQGWQALESSGGERFRWAGKSAEIVLSGGPAGGFADIALDLEPGPSYGPGPFHFGVEDSGGHSLFESPPISGRRIVRFRLALKGEDPSVFLLRSGGKGLPVPNDPRELDFRVFHIACGRSGNS